MPNSFRASGISCQPTLFVDPVLCVAAPMAGARQDHQLLMPFVSHREKYIISPYIDWLSFFFNRSWRKPMDGIASLMIKLADVEQGDVHSVTAKKVVTTCGAYALPSVLPFVKKEEMDKIANLVYAPVIQIGVGLRNVENHHYKAFGALIPSKEKKDVLGILFPSACFAGRASEAGETLAFFIGGVRHPEMLQWTDEQFVALVNDSLYSLLKYPETCITARCASSVMSMPSPSIRSRPTTVMPSSRPCNSAIPASASPVTCGAASAWPTA